MLVGVGNGGGVGDDVGLGASGLCDLFGDGIVPDHHQMLHQII